MLRTSLNSRNQRQGFILVNTIDNSKMCKCRFALCECAGLIDSDHRGITQRLQCIATTEQHIDRARLVELHQRRLEFSDVAGVCVRDGNDHIAFAQASARSRPFSALHTHTTLEVQLFLERRGEIGERQTQSLGRPRWLWLGGLGR
ncbi:hypothetical protein D9M69_512750 [compost metagenome]